MNNEMMAAHKNAVVIANIRETTRLGAWDRIMEIGAVELINENTQPRIAG